MRLTGQRHRVQRMNPAATVAGQSDDNKQGYILASNITVTRPLYSVDG